MIGILRRLVWAFGWLAAASAGAADAPSIKQVPTMAPVPLAAGTPPRSVDYKKTVTVSTDEKFGEVRRGIFCADPVPLILSSRVIQGVTATFAPAARRELKRLGFKDATVEASAFATKEQSSSADYEMAGTMRAVAAGLCTGGLRDNSGAVWVQMKWELFSPKQQKVVHTLITEGSMGSDRKIEKTINDYFEGAFVAALHNALADKDFAARLQADPGMASAQVAVPAFELLKLVRAPEGEDQADDEFSAQRSAVVTVFSGSGSGSGFYVDAEGYLLTNQHVVGDTKYVKVRLATGRDIVGEVVRSDRIRDVALVKTEAVGLRPMAVSKRAPVVGDDVFAIGSPYGDRFASSLTRGVLSGTSTVEQRRFLQSDVKVLPGSSGGPLLRRDGGVIGIVSGGIGQGPGAAVNVFIPIDEAIETIGIGFKP